MRAQSDASTTIDSVALALAAMADVRATNDLIADVGGGLFLCEDQGSRIAGMATLALTESYGDNTGLLHMRCMLRPPTQSPDPGLHALLLSLWIEPQDRGAGLGSMLVQHILSLSRARGARSISLTYDPASHGLGAFYERFGFRPA